MISRGPTASSSALTMSVRAIHNEAEHQAALKEIESLFRARKGTPDGDRLEVLVILTEAYEREHFHVAAPDPIAAIKIRAEEIGWGMKELAAALGDRSKLSQVLNRERRLSLAMIRSLAPLGLPAELLIQDTRRTGKKRVVARRPAAKSRGAGARKRRR